MNTDLDKRTPFDKVHYLDGHPHILVDSKWAKLVSIADLPIDTIITIAQESTPRDWKLGFHRYLHYILDDLKIKRGEYLNVSYTVNDNIIITQKKLKWENRDLATKYHDSIVKTNRITRKHALKTPILYDYLTTRIHGYDKMSEGWITYKEAIHDLEYLEWEIVNNYSYADLTGFDYKIALDAIRNDLKNGIAYQDFALQLKMFMANFGDGHSRVSIREVLKGKSLGRLPFEIISHENKFYAINTHTKDSYFPNHSLITKINNIEIEEFYELAGQMIAKTTSKFVKRNTTEYLRFLDLLLQMMDVQHTDQIMVTFENDQHQVTKAVNLGNKKNPKLIKNHLLKDTIMANNIGYIAMNEKMSRKESFINQLDNAMQNVKNTDGLIIDIRRNSGGSRKPLLTMLPYFIKKAKVVNIARYRINEAINHRPNTGYLTRRYCYPTTISKSNYEEESGLSNHSDFQSTVHDFKKNFDPRYTVPNDQFSDFHYMVIHPESNKKRYYYSKPVIVLIDEGCFSASDIFAAGMKTGDNVKLLGNTTGGGSGYSNRIQLPHSDLQVKLSRMVSYQPDGNLYDGHGVVPNFQVDYSLEDRMGKTDTMLNNALRRLTGINQRPK